MRTILEPIIKEQIIQKSKFITLIVPLETETISSILNEIKHQYQKANHYCYAYRFHELSGASDDGEPSGTAGRPILNVLQKRELDQLLVVVVRYFGGIKLGTGGLVRAYTNSVIQALTTAKLGTLLLGKELFLEMNYETYEELKKHSIQIQKVEFQEQVRCSIQVTNEEWEKLKKLPFQTVTIQKELWMRK